MYIISFAMMALGAGLVIYDLLVKFKVIRKYE